MANVRGLIAVLCVAAIGCSATERGGPDRASQDLIVVGFLGDSLTLGVQLDAGHHYPALLERRFAQVDLPIRAINAGYPGDTSIGGVARIDALLDEEPDIVVVALGVNDATNGISLETSASSLRVIAERARERGVVVILLGARVSCPWSDELSAVVAAVAEAQRAGLVDDMLAGVADSVDLDLGDGGTRRRGDNDFLPKTHGPRFSKLWLNSRPHFNVALEPPITS